MVFNAAKDLVYTMNGGNISSGGYRISKIINGKSKKKAETQEGGGVKLYNEDSGIPVGLLLLQRLHQYDHQHDNGNKHGVYDKEAHYKDKDARPKSNQKLVYASVMVDDDGNDNDGGENIELVIMPSGMISENKYSENPIEISSNEIDDEIYDSLIESVSGPGSESVAKMKQLTLFKKANTTKKQNFGKHKDIEKVYQKRKTRSKRHN